MLRIFQEKIERCNLTEKIHCTQQSAEDMDFKPDQFDIIASTVALHHVKFKEPVIKKVYDSLKDGGRFVIGEIDMDTTGRLDDPQAISENSEVPYGGTCTRDERGRHTGI